MMLQQTQTVRVVSKYTEWISRFPDIRTLAEAPLTDVLLYWSGLGYNRRARYLQQACRTIYTEYDGAFPEQPEKLEQLPGIGPYTARAVSTFAFNRPEVFIETNIRSVYIFFFFTGTTVKVSDSAILSFVEATLDRTDPRSWYYGLMDYGAELKKKVLNPGRRSSRYTTQSRFEGSLRQARGAVLRYLVRNGAATLEQIAAAENVDIYRLTEAAGQLWNEQLVCRTGSVYQIKN